MMSILGRHLTSRGMRISAALLIQALVTTAYATTFKVPDDFADIQAAVNAASSGDMVWVAQGTYKENIVLKPGVRLEGGFKSDFSARNWNTWPSVIDGDRKGSVVVGAKGATLDGFTLRNGEAQTGGGLRITNAAMTVKNNAIEDNSATDFGGGIFVSGAPQAPPYTDIEGNTIRRNKVTTDRGGRGGGIHVQHSAQGIRITNNVIGGFGDALGDGNTAEWGGGGIAVESTPIIQIERNTIRQNHVNKGHGGGVMIVDGSPNATLGENLIEFNSANGNYGGGVYSIGGTFVSRNNIGKNSVFNSLSWGGGLVVDSPSGTPPRVENNFIHGNMADKGGGIHLERGSNIILMNNSVANNKSNSPNMGGGFYVKAGATCILQNTILWGNGDDLHEESAGACSLDHNDIEDGDGAGSSGNINTPPMFVAYDDLHIVKGSPVINAGRSAAAPSIDIDADPRGSSVDIGADEYYSSDGGLPCALVRTADASHLMGHMDAVRTFRDKQLMSSEWGRSVVRGYYEESPQISTWLESHPWSKPIARVLVTPVVYAIAYPATTALLLVLVGIGLVRAVVLRRL